MPKPTATPTSAKATRSTGLLIALAFALIAVGVVIYIAVGYRSSARPAAIPTDVIDIGKAPAAEGSAADATQIQQTGAARLQFVDKNDPNRLAAELVCEKLDPMGQGYYTLTSPRAWIYFKDGRALHIRADNARVKMPSQQQQPESGEFHGTVVLRLFAAREAGTDQSPARSIDPDMDAPEVLAVTDSLAFDTVLLELDTQDPVTISARNLLYEGDGMLVRVNQVRERIELLRTTGKMLKYNPLLRSQKRPPVASGAGAGAGAGTGAVAGVDTEAALVPTAAVVAGATSAASPKVIKENLYRALVSDQVTVHQVGRSLTADTLELFGRLVDGRLPENAFGAVLTESGPSSADGAKAAAGAGSAPDPGKPAAAATLIPRPIAGSIEPLFISAGDKDVIMRWSGTLVMTPLTETSPPAELAKGNHFAARFSSVKAGGVDVVTLKDEETGATGTCASIEYAATTRTMAMLAGAGVESVTLDMPESGRLVVPSVRMDLGSGVAHVAGGGQLAALKAPKAFVGPLPENDPGRPMSAQVVRQITWQEQADFEFAQHEGRLRGALSSARFTGSVLARDASSSLSGDYLAADFITQGRQQTALRRIKVEGNVVGVAGAGRVDADRALPALDPYLTAQTLDVTFTPSKADPDQTEPTHALAIGGEGVSVRAQTRDAALTARSVETFIGRSANGDTVLTEIVASGNAFFERGDGVSARADILRARPEERTADLRSAPGGAPVVLARAGSTVVGSHVTLDDATGTMVCKGEGSFDHQPPPPDAGTPARASDQRRLMVTWTHGMRFNNAQGRIDCEGSAVVTSATRLSTQVAKAEKLRVNITPASQAGGGGDGAIEDRRLLRAEAIGAGVDEPVGGGVVSAAAGVVPATVEVRSYAYAPEAPGDDAKRTLEQLMFVEGPRIIADEQAGTMSVPGSGRAIIRDQRQAASGSGPLVAGGGGVGGGTRGTSRFIWGESMLFTRSTGVLSMKKDVEVTHLPLGGDRAIRLVALNVDAFFNVQGQAAGAGGAIQSADLIRAEAAGAVYAESGTQKLLGDRLVYEAATGMVEATASPGNRVTLYAEKQQPVTARKLLWNLRTDRVEVSEPAPTSGAR